MQTTHEPPGFQLLPEIPTPAVLTPGREYAVYVTRSVRSRAGRVRPRVVRVLARLVDIHPRRLGYDLEFLVFASTRPELLRPGLTLYLPQQPGQSPREWRVSEID